MMTLSELWKQFKLLTDRDALPKESLAVIERFLKTEYQIREKRRIEHLLKMSGIKRVKRLEDFDWSFNPKIPREKIMELINTDWLQKPCNIVIIGPTGVGKSHIADALCVDAIMKGHQAVSITIFDLTAKLSKARSIYGLIDYYARVKVLCLDEMGYVFPTKEQADCIFQIISKRVEIGTTIVTTNLVPSQWGKIFDSVTASAILDRLSLNGNFFTFEGRSYRSKR
ncbi:MAG: ATP-binding protein [Actinomycetota bacterium]|nr:ATP-binding protein [Actinomycetota bacterium]